MTRRLVAHDIAKLVNRELLTNELRAVLGDTLVRIYGIDTGTRIVLLDPSADALALVTQIVQAHDASALTDAQQTFATIKGLIQEAVGKSVSDLTTAERWALLAGLLYQNRAINPDMTVRPPRLWITSQDTNDD